MNSLGARKWYDPGFWDASNILCLDMLDCFKSVFTLKLRWINSNESNIFLQVCYCFDSLFKNKLGFPGGSEDKASPCNAGDLGLIPGSGRSPGEGNGNPLWYSCLENPTGRRSLVGYSPWNRKVSDTTKRLHFHFHEVKLN